MASYTEKKAKLTAEIDQMRGKVTDLIRRREALLVDEAVHYAEAAQPSAAAQIAGSLIMVYTEHHKVSLETLFGIQSAEVNTAGLLQLAEYRDAETIEMFLLNGADVNAVNNEGFSVLENILMGHSYYDIDPGEEVFEILAKYNVGKGVERWIIEERCAEAPKYVRDFLGLVDDEV